MDARVTMAPTPSVSRKRNGTILLRHLANFGPLAAISSAAGALAYGRVAEDGSLILGVMYGVVVALNVLVIAMSSWSAILGFGVLVLRWCGWRDPCPKLEAPTGRARTALVFAIHEENAARVFAAARVMAEDAGQAALGAVDVFVLSDSRSEAAIAAEATMLEHCAAPTRSGARIFYRRRAENVGRKAGNIGDFIERWGASYDFMVVLDADSLMTGKSIAQLVGAMEANPHAGLIQAMCYPVGRTSAFARIQQFDARIVGPVFQSGAALWQGPRGNFWGHNAIIRLTAFAASCGLAELPGPPPLGGAILSHDAVEAAFLLRAGYDLWMLPRGPDGEPVGSWEETPTNLLDHLERDKRWLRGNLQHIRLLYASGLKPASLYHLGRGLSHFLYAPLIVVWLLLYALLDRSIEIDPLMLTIGVLVFAPRALGLVAALGEGAKWRGVRVRLIVGALLGQIFIALIYPIVLVMHCSFMLTMPATGGSSWDAQARGERDLGWLETARRLGPSVAVAAVLLLALAPVAPLPVALLLPSLVLAVPLVVATSRKRAMRHLFTTPEDASIHPMRREHERVKKLLQGAARRACVIRDLVPAENGLAMPKHAIR